MKNMRKLLALLLCLALCLTLMPAAFAEGAEEEDLFVWEDAPPDAATPQEEPAYEEPAFVFEETPDETVDPTEVLVPPEVDAPEDVETEDLVGKAAAVVLSAANFPDSVFRAYLADNCDSDGDGTLSAYEISSIIYLGLSGKGISSLQGLSHLSYLRILDCSDNSIASLDLSQNSRLTTLYCRSNPLKSLDVSSLTSLDSLDFQYTEVASINLKSNTSLKYLYCNSSSLTSLDVSRNTALVFLQCNNDALSSLDLSHNPALEQVNCPSCGLKSLNVGNNPALVRLQCHGNSFTSLDISSSPTLVDAVLNGPREESCNTVGYGDYFYSGSNQSISGRRLVVDSFVTLITNSSTVTAPSITAQPKSISAADGETVTLSVRASGTNLSYQWQMLLPGATAWNNNTSVGYNTSSMTFTAREAYSGRKYRCVVSNSAGSVTSSAVTLTVSAAVAKPTITTQPKSLSLTAGDTATLSVRASGTNLRYQWQMLLPGATAWKNNTSAGYNTASMTFTAREAYSGRKYRCVVSNSAGSVTSSAVTLTVSAAAVTVPTITTQPKNISVTAGQTATLSLKAAGGNLSYQWQYQLPGKTAWTNNTSTGYNTASMSFTAREGFSGRKYRCVVSNGAGSVTSAAVTLTVSAAGAKPTITTQPKNVTVNAGQTATVSLKASGTGLTYQWQYQLPGKTAWTNNTSTGYNKSSMSFTARESFSGRKYRCVVSNSAGSVTSSAVTLTVVGKPAITTQPKNISVAAGQTATLSLKASGIGLTYQWQYQLPGRTAWTNNTSAGYNKSSMSFTAQEAFSGRKYRCVVTNSAGSVTSNAVTLTVTAAGTCRALVIGNRNYADGALYGCDDDMNAMAAMLPGFANSFHVTTLPDATADMIRSGIRSTFAGATEDDVSLFYYSGHGMNDSGGSVQGALVGINFNGYNSDYITTAELAALLSQVPGRVIVVLDSCHSGAAISTNGGDDALAAFNRSVVDAFAAVDAPLASDGLYDNAGELAQSKFVVITAASFYEESMSRYNPNTLHGYGVFTLCFVDGCGSDYSSGEYFGSMPADTNGDSRLTVSEIFSYAKTNASSMNSEQTAQCYAANMGEILFRR